MCMVWYSMAYVDYSIFCPFSKYVSTFYAEICGNFLLKYCSQPTELFYTARIVYIRSRAVYGLKYFGW